MRKVWKKVWKRDTLRRQGTWSAVLAGSSFSSRYVHHCKKIMGKVKVIVYTTYRAKCAKCFSFQNLQLWVFLKWSDFVFHFLHLPKAKEVWGFCVQFDFQPIKPLFLQKKNRAPLSVFKDNGKPWIEKILSSSTMTFSEMVDFIIAKSINLL